MKQTETFLVIIIVFSGMSSPTAWAASRERHVKKGNDFYQKQDFASSLKHYEEALRRDPESPVINFDAGTAFYKNGDFDQAIGHLQKALLSDDAALKTNAHYNLGNALYARGKAVADKDTERAIDTLKQSLAQFETVLNVDDRDPDARYNYDVVKKELEKLDKKLQEQRQKSKDQPDQDGRQQHKEPSSGTPPQLSDPKKPDEQNQSGEEPQEQKGGDGEDQHEAGSSAGRNEEGSAPGEELKKGEMTKEEAEMLLRQYQQNEEPRGLLNFMKNKSKETPVLKDW